MIRARAAVIAIACSVWACTPAGHDPPAGQDPPASRAPDLATVMDLGALDEAPAVIARAVIPPTPEMLKAALSNDPDAMRDAMAATAGTCHASSTCPAQFGSCSGWSTPSLCNETCGAPFCICRPIKDCEGEPPEPRGTDTFNSFRVCFDANQHGCTEWNSTTSTFCGC